LGQKCGLSSTIEKLAPDTNFAKKLYFVTEVHSEVFSMKMLNTVKTIAKKETTIGKN
jgi:hypothetical protein